MILKPHSYLLSTFFDESMSEKLIAKFYKKVLELKSNETFHECSLKKMFFSQL